MPWSPSRRDEAVPLDIFLKGSGVFSSVEVAGVNLHMGVGLSGAKMGSTGPASCAGKRYSKGLNLRSGGLQLGVGSVTCRRCL